MENSSKLLVLVALALMASVAVESLKPGNCQQVAPGTVGICVMQCSTDESCPGRQKCCSNGCGQVCSEPSSPISLGKPGRCPRVRPGTGGLCAEFCSGDHSCPGNNKCCSNGCGRSCQNPVF